MATTILRDPRALLKPDLQNLLRRAVEKGTFLAPYGFDVLAQDMVNFVTDPLQFMFLGAEQGSWKAVCLAYLPVGNLFPYPTVVMMYNEGSRRLNREMREHLMDTLISKGYTSLLAVNTSGRADPVWLRALTLEGGKGNIVGSLAMFEVK